MKRKIFTLMFALPLLFAGQAKAAHNDYCREFTKTIRIGHNLENGYGKACIQPDGSWQMVASRGFDDPRDAFPYEIRRKIVYYEPVYYAPRPVYYYPRYHSSPGLNFVFSFRDDDHKGHYYNNKKYHHDRGRDWNHGKGHGRGHGGGHDRGRH